MGALYAYFVLMGVDTIKKRKKISDLMELVALLLIFFGLFGFRWVLTYSGFSA